MMPNAILSIHYKGSQDHYFFPRKQNQNLKSANFKANLSPEDNSCPLEYFFFLSYFLSYHFINEYLGPAISCTYFFFCFISDCGLKQSNQQPGNASQGETCP